METVRVATSNIQVTFNKKANVDKMVNMTVQAARSGAKLIVFAEQAVQGYFNSLVGPLTTSIIRYHQENAEVIPEGESTQRMIKAAQENDIYVIYGMTERDKFFYDVLYNTAVLVGPEGFIGTYRKVHQPIDEKHIYSRGYDFPVYDTAIGRIGMQICMDKEFPEATREMALKGADIVCELAAWEHFIGDVVEMCGRSLGSTYDIFDCVRAMENQIWFISSNFVGKNEMGNFCGHANIVDPNGFILTTAGDEEGIVYADIDVRGEIQKNRAVFLQTCIKERNPAAYKVQSSGTWLQGVTELQTKDNISDIR